MLMESGKEHLQLKQIPMFLGTMCGQVKKGSQQMNSFSKLYRR